MTKKHFELLARELGRERALWVEASGKTSQHYEPGSGGRVLAHIASGQLLKGFDAAVRKVADVCENSNPRFNRERFLKACGIDSEKGS
jgi:hypothetical protein